MLQFAIVLLICVGITWYSVELGGCKVRDVGHNGTVDGTFIEVLHRIPHIGNIVRNRLLGSDRFVCVHTVVAVWRTPWGLQKKKYTKYNNQFLSARNLSLEFKNM